MHVSIQNDVRAGSPSIPDAGLKGEANVYLTLYCISDIYGHGRLWAQHLQQAVKHEEHGQLYRMQWRRHACLRAPVCCDQAVMQTLQSSVRPDVSLRWQQEQGTDLGKPATGVKRRAQRPARLQRNAAVRRPDPQDAAVAGWYPYGTCA